MTQKSVDWKSLGISVHNKLPSTLKRLKFPHASLPLYLL